MHQRSKQYAAHLKRQILILHFILILKSLEHIIRESNETDNRFSFIIKQRFYFRIQIQIIKIIMPT